MQIQFTMLNNNHLALLHQLFLQPHVAYWWPEPQEVLEFHTKWSTRIETRLSAYHTPWFGHVVEIDGIPIGYIQHFFLKTHKVYGYPVSLAQTVGLDFFIGDPNYLGKKLSAPILEHYFCEIKSMHPQVTTILIEPDSTNLRALHVYTKAGFKKIGTHTDAHRCVALLYKHL